MADSDEGPAARRHGLQPQPRRHGGGRQASDGARGSRCSPPGSAETGSRTRTGGREGKQRFPGLARIIPTNHDAAQALANFNGERGREDRKTVLVYDKRPDGYNESLAKAFSGIKEKGPAGPAAMPFESPGIDEAGLDRQPVHPDRQQHLRLRGRHRLLRGAHAAPADLRAQARPGGAAQNRHYTIVSGSDAASLRQAMSEKDWAQLRGEGGEAKVTVQYAAPAHPDAWRAELAGWKKKWDEDPRPQAHREGAPPVPHRAQGGPGRP